MVKHPAGADCVIEQDATDEDGVREKFRISLTVFILCLGASLTGCQLLPSQENRSVSVAYADTGNTSLGKAVEPRVAAHPGYSGIHPLPDPLDSFAARARLVQAAERSLDLQYYTWKKDMTGTLLFDSRRSTRRRSAASAYGCCWMTIIPKA